MLAKAVGSPWAWAAFFSVLFGFHISRATIFADRPPPPPKVFYELPDFELTDQFGKQFGSKDLRGKVWVANFVFTHCPTMCEQLTKSMAGLQKRMRTLRDSAYTVSFSVDPENDTPEVLAKYAAKHDANQYRWRFLTGDIEAVKEAVVKGFKLPMEKDMTTEDAMMNITHGTRFVIVDRQMRIRGYYETDDESIQLLLNDLGRVANE